MTVRIALIGNSHLAAFRSAWDAWEKRSKMESRCAAAIPHPLSRTENWIASGMMAPSRSAIVPPGFVNFIALPTRFVST